VTDLELHQGGDLTQDEWSLITIQAAAFAKSDIIPSAYRRKPENVMVAAVTGRDFGWNPLTAMRNMHIIEGKATISAEAMVALARQNGHSISGSVNDDRAEVKGKRRDTGDTMEISFSMADAKRAGLLRKGPWTQYPKSMMWARAVSQLCRMLFPDVLLGCSYVPEELGADVQDDGTDIDLELAGEVELARPDLELAGEVELARPAPEIVAGESDEIRDARQALLGRCKKLSGTDPEFKPALKQFLADGKFPGPLSEPVWELEQVVRVSDWLTHVVEGVEDAVVFDPDCILCAGTGVFADEQSGEVVDCDCGDQS